jgi:glyoxylase-like metal-dependent hydrolase (beta-lactamase superfamily II)
VTYESGGDRWFGFESIRVMEGVDREIALIPLPGHSRGHCAVAVRDGERWLLDAGDVYFHRDEVAPTPSCPPALRAFQTYMAADNGSRTHNRDRVQELAQSHGDEIRIFCSHDEVELAREQ